MKTETISLVLSYLTIGLAVLLLLLLVFVVVAYFNSKVKEGFDKLIKRMRPRIFLLIFLLLFGAVVSSLYYSQVVGFAPCELCWYQRISIFSLALIFGIAAIKKDSNIYPYALTLSLFGCIVAFYHVYVQFFQNKLGVCSTEGLTISCSKRYIEAISFISIPVMSLVVLFTVIVAMVIFVREDFQTQS